MISSDDVYKHNHRALKWVWSRRDILTLDLSHHPIKGRHLFKGGVKVWIYQRKTISGEITVSFYPHVYTYKFIKPECTFTMSLKFTGWRAVWVSFQECRRGQRLHPLYRLQFQAPNLHVGVLYFDLLNIVRSNFIRQSRDSIVPPIISTHMPFNVWQQTYYWSQVKSKTEVFNDLELNDDQLYRLKEIRLISKRLRDWYVVPGKSTFELTGKYKKRWKGIRKSIKRARKNLLALNITKDARGFIKGPGLFSHNSAFGKLSASSTEIKFGFVFRYILLPLSFEYFFATRKEEIHKAIKLTMSTYKKRKTQKATLKMLTYDDEEFINKFVEMFGHLLSENKLSTALKKMNEKRLSRILRIFEYIADQGWDEGSALGSLDHEMNRSSKGFVTSIFLLRKPLYKAGLLPRLIKIMKWYLEFGELYQKPFKFIGTTADRLRTLFLYRLMCVLVMPETTLQEVMQKLHDMKALKAWYENALTINPALGGTIKPDFTGYHHKSFYPNDYVLPGLLTAAHVVYLLRGTTYELSTQSRENLRNAINFMRLLSEKYVIPNTVTNASPTTAKPELICLIPAFAYAALWEKIPDDLHDLRLKQEQERNVRLSSSNMYKPYLVNMILSNRPRIYSEVVAYPHQILDYHKDNPFLRNTQNKESLRAFLRLLNESDDNVQRYLGRGRGCSWKTSYMHTLGSLSILYELKKRAKELGIQAEVTPQGNWAKNFAALSIHRREAWVITVKGFNNFVWGSESAVDQNKYGRYQSYGQLLIVNTDQGLKAHDIERGWDWNRLPGTTSLRMPARQLKTKKSRYYNPKSLCGGINFQGTSRYRNGAFTMDFERPTYEDEVARFWFKKSVFFYENLVVCLGSDIRSKSLGLKLYDVETTLFQNTPGDKMMFIKANGYNIPLGLNQPSRWLTWGKNSPGMLMDINQNGYYIPNAGKQNLNVWLLNQTSPDTKAKAYYATAVIRHGTNPKGVNYEYAILVNCSYRNVLRMAQKQRRTGRQPRYRILNQDYRAHVVELLNSPRVGLTTYYYSIFKSNVVLPGPLRSVGDPCILMVEYGNTRLAIGISFPQLNFNSTRKLRTSHDAREEELYYMQSQEKRIWVLLRDKVQRNAIRISVDGKAVGKQDYDKYVRIYEQLHDNDNAASMILFKNLFNGFTTEVHLRKIVKN